MSDLRSDMQHNDGGSESRLCPFDRDLLRHLSGETVPGLVWGSAMGESVEWLYGRGLVRREHTPKGIEYAITDAGRAALAASST